jgi:putative hydrolase of HD superfamily
VHKGIDKPESIASHMYRMAIMALCLPQHLDIDGVKTVVDKTRCMQMSIVHDLAESIVGDITPHCGITKDAKRTMELVHFV